MKPDPMKKLEEVKAMKGRKVEKPPENVSPYDLEKLRGSKPDEVLKKLKELKTKYSK
jgi:hypothetical protein